MWITKNGKRIFVKHTPSSMITAKETGGNMGMNKFTLHEQEHRVHSNVDKSTFATRESREKYYKDSKKDLERVVPMEHDPRHPFEMKKAHAIGRTRVMHLSETGSSKKEDERFSKFVHKTGGTRGIGHRL